MTAARLKALGTESVVLERSVKIGDSWANRYDSLKFHVPTSNCEMPYRCKPSFPSKVTRCFFMHRSELIPVSSSLSKRAAESPSLVEG